MKVTSAKRAREQGSRGRLGSVSLTTQAKARGDKARWVQTRCVHETGETYDELQ